MGKYRKIVRDGVGKIINHFYPYTENDDSEYGFYLDDNTPYRIVITGFVIIALIYAFIGYLAPKLLLVLFLSIYFHGKEDMVEETEEICRDMGVMPEDVDVQESTE